MKTINTKVECMSFLVECEDGDQDGTMFIVFHRGNAKRMFKFQADWVKVEIEGVTLDCSLPIFSVRNAILKKFVNDLHSKYQVCMVHPGSMTQMQLHVALATLRSLNVEQHKMKSKAVWRKHKHGVEPYDED